MCFFKASNGETARETGRLKEENRNLQLRIQELEQKLAKIDKAQEERLLSLSASISNAGMVPQT
eukprot:612120-Hanusia_phi.AAC.3